jgi:hypothetical protein
VVLAGHHLREWNDLPKLPTYADGRLAAHFEADVQAMRQVFEDFSLRRAARLTPLPDSVPLFLISPGLFLLNPHYERIHNPDDAVLIGEEPFLGHKTGGSKDVFLRLFREAQGKLGTGLSLADYRAGKAAPETAWQPTPEDAALWQEARRRMGVIAGALRLYREDEGAYPDDLEELRDWLPRGRIPCDPFLGDYFRYWLTEEGFALVCYGRGDEVGGDDIPERDILFTERGEAGR